jgi:plasmid stabilization system protein ParE
VRRYRLGAGVDADLEAIWDHIAMDDVEAANTWIAKLIDSFGQLAAHPGMGHSRKDITQHPVFFWPVGAYLVIYRLTGELVEVAAVLHGARDVSRFLSDRFS